MSVQATTWVWEHSQASGNARLVLLAIADGANREGCNSCQSAKTVAKMCNLGSRTVQRKIDELIGLGELQKDGVDGKYQTNIYSLPGVSMQESLRHSDVRQNDVYVKTDTSLRQNETVVTSPMTHYPINPNISKDIYPIGGAEAQPKKRAVNIPEYFQPRADDITKAKERYPLLNLELETERFVNYHQAKGSKFKDWQAAWRNWMMKAEEFRSKSSTGGNTFEVMGNIGGHLNSFDAPASEPYRWGDDER